MSDYEGHTPGPWIIATSCSYRRILSERGDGVCEPIVQRSDGHPDLHFHNGGFTGPDARLIAAAPGLLAENAKLQAHLGEALELLKMISPVDSGRYRLLASMHLPQDIWIKRRDALLEALAGGSE